VLQISDLKSLSGIDFYTAATFEVGITGVSF